MNRAYLLPFGPELFFPQFLVLWVTLTAALSFIGGWHELSATYRAPGRPGGASFPFASASFGARYLPVGYGGVLFMRLDETGIYFSVFPLLRLMHPPLLIPWRAITKTADAGFFLSKGVRLHIDGFERTIVVYGSAGKEIRRRVPGGAAR